MTSTKNRGSYVIEVEKAPEAECVWLYVNVLLSDGTLMKTPQSHSNKGDPERSELYTVRIPAGKKFLAVFKVGGKSPSEVKGKVFYEDGSGGRTLVMESKGPFLDFLGGPSEPQ